MSQSVAFAGQDEATSDLVAISLIAIGMVSAMAVGIAVTPMDDFLQGAWTALSFL